MKKSILICSTFIVSHCMGQIPMKNYQFSQALGSYTPISGGTVLGTESNDDLAFNNNTAGIHTPSYFDNPVNGSGFPIGFNFFYNGFPFNKFGVSADGFIQLGTGNFNILNIPGHVLEYPDFHFAISALNTDLKGSPGSILQFKTIGAQPNRQLVLQWSNYGYKDCSSEEKINLQIVLNETSNTIQFVYGDFVITNSAGVSAFVGLRGNLYTDYTNRTYSSSWSSTTSGTSLDGSDFCQLSSSNFPSRGLTFTYTPPNGPLVSSYFPVFDANNVALDANIVLTFSENVQKGVGNITVGDGLGVIKQLIDVTSNKVSILENIVTIDPDNFPAGSISSVVVPEGVFKDRSGNSFSGIGNGQYDVLRWSFRACNPGDFTPPLITVTLPADGDANVPGGEYANLQITFSERILIGTGNIYIKEAGNIKKTIDVTSSNIISSYDNIVSIATGRYGLLKDRKAVNIEIDRGAFKDYNGNAFIGISDAATWNFTMEPDILAPSISTMYPVDGSAFVNEKAKLRIQFSEEVKKGTGNIYIKEAGVITQTINVTDMKVNVSSDSSIVTIDNLNFTLGAAVNIEIEAGAFNDMSNNPYSGISNSTDWNFTVIGSIDNSPPTVYGFLPASGATGVNTSDNILITLNEMIQKGSGNIIIEEDGVIKQIIDVLGNNVVVSGNSISIDPPSDFAEGTAIGIKIDAGAFRDMEGNNFSGISNFTDWKFTTTGYVDITPPLVNTFFPASGTTVNKSVNLVISFNEVVQKGLGNITIEEAGVIKLLIDVSGSNVVVSGNEVTINPPNDFTEGTAIDVKIDAGAFKDRLGNNFAGINNSTDWNFTIGSDNVPPTVNAFLPASGAIGVSKSDNLVITFSETIQKRVGNISIEEAGVLKQLIDINGSNVLISGSILTIDPPLDFTEGAVIDIKIDADAFRDIAGNNFAGISN